MKGLPKVSIIIPVKNEGIHIKNTIESAYEVKTICSFEIIVVDDASTDGCCCFLENTEIDLVKLFTTNGLGAANARNFGAQQSTGEFLIFCDAHLIFGDFWIEKLLIPIINGQADASSPGIAPTDKPEVVGYGMNLTKDLQIEWNDRSEDIFETPILPGGCLAITKEAFTNVQGFDTGFRIWGYEDVELSLKLWLFGYTCVIVPTVKILHVFRESHPYEVDHDSINYNLLWMAYKHFSKERIEKCKQLIQYSDPLEIEKQVIANSAILYREAYFQSRRFEDHWFFSKFHINF